jgi:[CysO sulfur-carrier protein]-S-L-cysteine hydrolase
VNLPQPIAEAIRAHAAWTFPAEACGLLAFDADGALRMAYCLTNTESDTSRFTIDPTEHFGAQSHAERCGWRIGGVFHSHPHSPPIPSAHDIAGALDPDWVYVIAGPVGEDTAIRTYRIRQGSVHEITGAVVA